ncbi:MAG: DUF6599 family protein [Acidobacteriota bacterium]
MSESMIDFNQSLPVSIDGWTKSEPPDRFTPETLSSYIDGGAELFLSYNFEGSISLKYKDSADAEIIVDIFDMGSSYDAFGAFAHSRETIDSRFGQGSEYAGGLLTFWKDRYYVSILAFPETPAKRDVVFRVADAISGAIKNDGALPPVIALLPAEDLIPESVKYFHHYVWLNSFSFVSAENVLDIGNDTPAALGKYRQEGATCYVLVVRYPDAALAEAAGEQFRQKVLGGGTEMTRVMDDGRWTGLQRRGELLSIVFNAPDAQAVRNILTKIRE